MFCQSESIHDLDIGEVYVQESNISTAGNIIFKVESKKYYSTNDTDYKTSRIISESSFSSNFTLCSKTLKYLVRKANANEKDWLEACIRENRFIPKDEFGMSRGKSLSANINLNRTALDATYHGIQKEGWQFSNVPFRYQFVNCGGEVQMGVQYEKKADFITLVHNGSVYYEAHAPDLWPNSNQIEVGDVMAKLYYGNQYFGDVKLTYIVGNFAGCFGETFDVLKQVGKNPSQKDFLENLDKFSLKDIRIIRGDVTINYERKQQIIKAVSYDAFGNPIKSDSKPASSNSQGNNKPKYDAFGNPIKN